MRVDPRPTKKGELSVGVNLDITVSDRARGGSVLPNLEATIRYGISERVDIGAKVGLLGGEVSSKICLVDGGLSLALVPGAAVGIASLAGDDSQAFVGTFFLPLLVGVDLGERARLVLGVKPLAQAAGGGGLSGETLRYGGFVFAPGALVGLRLPLGDTFVVFPEVVVHVPYAVDASRWLPPLWQGGVGVQFAVGR